VRYAIPITKNTLPTTAEKIMKKLVTSLEKLLLLVFVFVVIEMLVGDTEVKIDKAVREIPNTKIRIPPTIVKMAIMVTPVGLFCSSNVFHFFTDI
jgi:hypothetical protein